MIGSFALVERMVPNSRITEGLAFTASGLSLGMAAGTFAAGVLIDQVGHAPALALAALMAGAAAMTLWSRSRTLAELEARADAAEPSPADARAANDLVGVVAG